MKKYAQQNSSITETLFTDIKSIWSLFKYISKTNI